MGSGKELPWTTGVGSGWSAPLASAPGKGARPLGAPLRGFEGRLTAGPSQLQPHTFLATWAHIPAGWGRGASLSQPSAGDPGLCPALAAYWRLSVGKSVLARGPHRPATHKSAPTIRLPSPPLATLPSRALPPRRPGLGAQTPEVMTDSERRRLRAHRGSGRVPRTLLPNSLLSLDEKFAGASAAPSRGRVVVETEVADIPGRRRSGLAGGGGRKGVSPGGGQGGCHVAPPASAARSPGGLTLRSPQPHRERQGRTPARRGVRLRGTLWPSRNQASCPPPRQVEPKRLLPCWGKVRPRSALAQRRGSGA